MDLPGLIDPGAVAFRDRNGDVGFNLWGWRRALSLVFRPVCSLADSVTVVRRKAERAFSLCGFSAREAHSLGPRASLQVQVTLHFQQARGGYFGAPLRREVVLRPMPPCLGTHSVEYIHPHAGPLKGVWDGEGVFLLIPGCLRIRARPGGVELLWGGSRARWSRWGRIRGTHLSGGAFRVRFMLMGVYI